MSQNNIRYDAWMSEILGKPCYGVTINRQFIESCAVVGTEEKMWLDKIHREHVFTFTKINTTDIPFIRFAEKQGFNLVDTNVSLVLKQPAKAENDDNSTYNCCFATSADEEAACDVGRMSFNFTRFHLDDFIPKKTADYIKAEWVRNYFKGRRGDKMVLAKSGDGTVGFLQLFVNPIAIGSDVVVIDLIAVAPEHRRKGLAGKMISFAINKLCNGQRMMVGTQIANIPSIKLYQQLGFVFDNAQYVFHYHN